MEENIRLAIDSLRTQQGGLNSSRLRSERYSSYVNTINNYIPLDLTIPQKVYLIESGLSSPPVCSCGKTACWSRAKKSFSQYCSIKCAANDPLLKQRKEDTNLAKYGTKQVLSSATVIAKRKQTNIEKYGVESPFHSKDIQSQIRSNNIEKYGVDNPLKRQEIKDKVKNTNLERYGSTSPLHNEEIKKKSKLTMVQKFGVEHAHQNKSVKASFKETMIKLYGSPNALQNEAIKKVFFNTILERYGVKNVARIGASSETRKNSTYNGLVSGTRTKNLVTPLFSREEFKGVQQERYQWECTTCHNQFEDHIEDGHIPRCKVCYPNQTGTSKPELEIIEFLEAYIPKDKIYQSDRTILDPKEIDIYLPDYKLGIEYNGTFWHSESMGKGKKYHVNKTKKANSKDVDLIHIFEWDWRDKKDIIKSMLLNRIGLSTKLMARKLSISIVSQKEEKIFLEENHIQGYSPSKVCYGLFEDTLGLVQLASFGAPRFTKNYEWELVRMVNLRGFSVQGGFSRLLGHFNNLHNPKSIITYCDAKYFNGKGYIASGFTQLANSEPAYWYTKDYYTVESRFKFQKKRLNKKLGVYDSSLSETENMKINGYDRVWDCGNLVFEWNKTSERSKR